MHTLLVHILVYNVFTHRSIYSIANKSVFLTMPWEYGTYVKNTQYFFSQQTLKHIFIFKLPLISYQPNLKILHACYKYIPVFIYFKIVLFQMKYSILYTCIYIYMSSMMIITFSFLLSLQQYLYNCAKFSGPKSA